MNKALETMLIKYDPRTPQDWLGAVREVVQEIALLGLWRAGFFDHAAFYGGTALRIFYGLDRFSEDLDFSLLDEQSGVRLSAALSSVRMELAAWGFSFDAEPKTDGDRTGIESAFLKGSTQVNLLNIGVPDELTRRFQHNQKIRIKLELDVTPPPYAGTEMKTPFSPTPFQVRLYDLPSLFAGKLHALLFRDWKSRVKGRDFYDFVWYAGQSVPVNLRHLEARMKQSGHGYDGALDEKALQSLLRERIVAVDLAAAAEEVRPFLRDPQVLTLWRPAFFNELISRIRTVPA